MVPQTNTEPIDASGIILTTFTKSAAADFIRKAREVLIDKNRPDKAAELDGALIGTVHSICERFIRKYWFELGLTLPLNILSDVDKKLYMSRIAEIVASEDDVLFFSEFAREFNMNEDFWKTALADIINGKYSFGIEKLDNSRDTSLSFIDNVFSGSEVNQDDRNRLTAILERVLKLVQDQNKVKETPTGKDREAKLKKTLSESVFVQASLILSIIDFDKESVYTKGFWESLVKDGIDFIRISDIAGKYVVSCTIKDRLKECTRKLFVLAKAWEKEYEDFKKENGLLDFNDMEQKFITLLTEDKFKIVRKDIKDTYKVMMVDEFQDSNPVQIKIFRKLMELVGETVLVGDGKQAIYGFRGTESSLVKEFIEEIPGKESLRISFRSRPELVRAANDIFCKAYGITKQEPVPDNPSAQYDGLSLHPDRKTHDEQDPALQHWNAPLKSSKSTKVDYLYVGKKIREIVESKNCLVVRKVKNKETGKEEEKMDIIHYGDIAILLRNGKSIGDIAQKLRESGVPVSIQETDFIGWAEVQLVLSLLRYIINPKDRGARADIMHLIGGISTEDIIKNAVEDKDDSESSLFKWLDDVRSRVSVLSVSEIVDSLALELDIHGNTVPWGLSKTRIRNLDFLSQVAREYEQLCANMNTVPSLPGFIAYVYEYEPEGHKVDRANTVKVITCHAAKGLEWPMVILAELDCLDISDQEIAKKEVRGVHSFRKNGSDQVQLLVFPEILLEKHGSFTSSKNIPKPIVKKMKETEYFKTITNRKIEEERNVLYVAFTRAKDYLITLGYTSSKYSWLANCGAAAWKVGKMVHVPDIDRFTLWHTDHLSAYYDLQVLPEESDQNGTEPQAWAIPVKTDFGDKYQSPSKHDRKKSDPDTTCSVSKQVTLTDVFQGKGMIHNIPNDKNEKEDSDTDNIVTRCGTCIHHIFAAYNPNSDKVDMVQMADRIIKGMGLTKEFPSPESVIDSAAQFFGWLKDAYGEGTALHELPFVNKQKDGTIIRGEMDLVWDLPDGSCVLVDYKSFHDNKELNAIKAHACKLGYPSQLKTYKGMLESGSKKGRRKVKDVLIYYFVLGKVVKLDVY